MKKIDVLKKNHADNMTKIFNKYNVFFAFNNELIVE